MCSPPKIKHRITIWSTSGYMPLIIKSRNSSTYLYTYVHSSETGEFPGPPHRMCDRGVAHLFGGHCCSNPWGEEGTQTDRCRRPSGHVLWYPLLALLSTDGLSVNQHNGLSAFLQGQRDSVTTFCFLTLAQHLERIGSLKDECGVLLSGGDGSQWNG